MKWFHVECIGGEKQGVVWHCDFCLTLPNQLHQVMDLVLRLNGNQTAMQKSLDTLMSQCKLLRTENAHLRTQIEKLQTPSRNISSCTSSRNVVIGDSLIRDIDEDKLVSTKVVALSGGKVQDAIRELEDCTEPFHDVYLCIGTNDCGRSEFDEQAFAEGYRTLIDVAMEKTSDASNVHVVSIPPRTDSAQAMEHVDRANGCVASLAHEMSIAMVNNEQCFKLANGSVNDAYLLRDGLHLSYCGTRRIVSNMGLPLKNSAQGDPVKRNRGSVGSHRHSFQPAPRRAPEQNQTHGSSAQSFNSNESFDRRRLISHPRHQHPQKSPCHFCGEQNHASNNCRYGRPIVCYSCKAQGHKARSCRHRQF
jgi:lysophospholipase L1-like esterase